MPISINCGKCSAKINAPDAAAGKRVKCPKCASPILVPAADDFEIVDDEPRRPVMSAKKPVAAEVDDDEEEVVRPKKKSRPRDEDDDEDDERPRKKNAVVKKKGIPVWIFAVAGVGIFAVIGIVVLFFVLWAKPGGGIAGGGPGGLLGASTPAGYTAVRETEGGFAVFLPGEAKKVNATVNGQNAADLGHHGWAVVGGFESGKQGSAWSYPLTAGFTPGTDQDSLKTLLAKYDNSAMANKDGIEIVGQRMLTLGGKPALELKTKEKARIWSKPGDDGFWKEKDREEIERVAKDGQYTVKYIVHDGKRVYFITIIQKQEFPTADALKIITDSFTIL